LSRSFVDTIRWALRPPDLHELKAQRYPLAGLKLGLVVSIAMLESVL